MKEQLCSDLTLVKRLVNKDACLCCSTDLHQHNAGLYYVLSEAIAT